MKYKELEVDYSTVRKGDISVSSSGISLTILTKIRNEKILVNTNSRTRIVNYSWTGFSQSAQVFRKSDK